MVLNELRKVEITNDARTIESIHNLHDEMNSSWFCLSASIMFLFAFMIWYAIIPNAFVSYDQLGNSYNAIGMILFLLGLLVTLCLVSVWVNYSYIAKGYNYRKRKVEYVKDLEPKW